MKTVLTITILFLIAGSLWYGVGSHKDEFPSEQQPVVVEDVIIPSSKEPNPFLVEEDHDSSHPHSHEKGVHFHGELQEVNTGCFADGECYVTVDGKKVILLIGWSRETVGSVKGADGIGGLEEFIGTEVEVYAGITESGEYTLYGDENYNVATVDAQYPPEISDIERV